MHVSSAGQYHRDHNQRMQPVAWFPVGMGFAGTIPSIPALLPAEAEWIQPYPKLCVMLSPRSPVPY